MPRRRAKKIRLSQIRALSRLQVSEREAAAFFGVSLKTFRSVIERDVKAAEAWEDGRENGKISIRRKQFRLADTSATMAIFLGKQYLGQHDVVHTEVSGPGGGPIETLDLSKLNANEREDLRRIIELTRKDKPG